MQNFGAIYIHFLCVVDVFPKARKLSRIQPGPENSDISKLSVAKIVYDQLFYYWSFVSSLENPPKTGIYLTVREYAKIHINSRFWLRCAHVNSQLRCVENYARILLSGNMQRYDNSNIAIARWNNCERAREREIESETRKKNGMQITVWLLINGAHRIYASINLAKETPIFKKNQTCNFLTGFVHDNDARRNAQKFTYIILHNRNHRFKLMYKIKLYSFNERKKQNTHHKIRCFDTTFNREKQQIRYQRNCRLLIVEISIWLIAISGTPNVFVLMSNDVLNLKKNKNNKNSLWGSLFWCYLDQCNRSYAVAWSVEVSQKSWLTFYGYANTPSGWKITILLWMRLN